MVWLPGGHDSFISIVPHPQLDANRAMNSSKRGGSGEGVGMLHSPARVGWISVDPAVVLTRKNALFAGHDEGAEN